MAWLLWNLSLTDRKTDAPVGSDAKDAAPSKPLRTSRRPPATMSRALGFSYDPGFPVQIFCLDNLTNQARVRETWKGKGNREHNLTRAGLTKLVVGGVKKKKYPVTFFFPVLRSNPYIC